MDQEDIPEDWQSFGSGKFMWFFMYSVYNREGQKVIVSFGVIRYHVREIAKLCHKMPQGTAQRKGLIPKLQGFRKSIK